MEWARILAYITGTVDQELLLRSEYLAAENRILKAQLKGLCVPKTSSGDDFGFRQAKIPCSCARIPCSAEIIPCSVA
jgi:hypothetical protein